MTFLDLVERVLQESNKPMKSGQIWQTAVDKGYDKELPPPSGGERLTPWSTISAQLSVNLRKENTVFIRTGEGYFWLKEKVKSENELFVLAEKLEKDQDISSGLSKKEEKDLHPPLAQYLYETYEIYTKTINANKISKTKEGEMKWGTPDMAGVSFTEYKDPLQTLRQQMGLSNIKLHAYELKLKLNTSNLTEYFFQAVSNSSWANEAWLVALDIQDDSDFMQELMRLNQAFGIGILQLDDINPLESTVIYAAKNRTSLDWNTMEKLIKNNDFQQFIEHISDAVNSKDKINKRLKEKIKLGHFDNPDI